MTTTCFSIPGHKSFHHFRWSIQSHSTNLAWSLSTYSSRHSLNISSLTPSMSSSVKLAAHPSYSSVTYSSGQQNFFYLGHLLVFAVSCARQRRPEEEKGMSAWRILNVMIRGLYLVLKSTGNNSTAWRRWRAWFNVQGFTPVTMWKVMWMAN